MDESIWQRYDFHNRITQILENAPDRGHHLGRSFLSPYQIAIEFERQYPEDFEAIEMPIGGLNTGQRTSFSQYIARELSRRIKKREITNIEGAFISSQDLENMSFTGDIHSSLTDSGFDLSIFRLI